MPTGAGVIIGRFQVADLTRGHDELLHRVARNHNKIVILLGVHPKLSSQEHPLNFESREHMLRVHWSETIGKNTSKKLVIAPLPDRATDIIWSKQVDILLDSLLGPVVGKTLYGGRDSFADHYCGEIAIGDIRTEGEKANNQEFYVDGSGTDQRRELCESPPMTEEGRAGAIWSTGHRWNRIDPCVDMAVVRVVNQMVKCEYQVLMGRKLNAGGSFCFPGGHIDHKDASAEAAASRELKEETGLNILPEDWEYCCHLPINDWRNTPGTRTWSTLYVREIDDEQDPCAGDDLDAVEWVDLRVNMEAVSPSHREMFYKLRSAYNIHMTFDVVEVPDGENDEPT